MSELGRLRERLAKAIAPGRMVVKGGHDDVADLTRFVSVRFYLPGVGPVLEIFDRQSPGEVAAWDDNARWYRSQVVGMAATRDALVKDTP